MFSLKDFIKKGLLDEADLAEINAKIEAQYVTEEIPQAEEVSV